MLSLDMKVQCLSQLSETCMTALKERYEICDDTTAQVIVGNPDPESLSEYKRLELIQLESAGYDQYDVEMLNQNKIRLCNASRLFR